jgi:hypothetical protein
MDMDVIGGPFTRITEDIWCFRIGLVDGTVFEFETAELSDVASDWIVLHDARPIGDSSGFLWGRPVWIRKSTIAWIGDNNT